MYSLFECKDIIILRYWGGPLYKRFVWLYKRSTFLFKLTKRALSEVKPCSFDDNKDNLPPQYFPSFFLQKCSTRIKYWCRTIVYPCWTIVHCCSTMVQTHTTMVQTRTTKTYCSSTIVHCWWTINYCSTTIVYCCWTNS